MGSRRLDVFDAPLVGSPKSHCHATIPGEVVSALNVTENGISHAVLSGEENAGTGNGGTVIVCIAALTQFPSVVVKETVY